MPQLAQTAPPAPPARRHIPVLDGLRGLAVVLVLLFHLDRLSGAAWPDRVLARLFGAGWVGVDLFFVLSGFLITGILVDTAAQRNFFRNFYARRALRIFPLYYALLVVGFAVYPTFAPAIHADRDWRLFLDGQWWFWSYLANIRLAAVGGAQMNFGHLWSVAIEEQFYLVWPLLVWWLSRRTLLAVALSLAVGAFLLRLWMLAHGGAAVAVAGVHVPTTPYAVYLLTATRIDGLALGAAVALWARGPRGWSPLARWATPAVAASVAVVVAVAWADRGFGPQARWTQRIGFSAIAILAAALLVRAVTAPSSSRTARVLGHAALRHVGRYSYGLYLVHYPILWWLESFGLRIGRVATLGGSQLPGQVVFFAVAGGASYAAARLTWICLERPCLALKRFFEGDAPPAPAYDVAPAQLAA